MTERVQLNLRIPSVIKERYERHIEETVGTVRPWAGIELERELRAQFDMPFPTVGAEADVSKYPAEKISSVGVPDGESTKVMYRIHPDVKNRLKSHAAQSNYSSAGQYIAKILMVKISDTPDMTEDEELSTAEKRTREIIESLRDEVGEELISFTMDDFRSALDQTESLSATDYAVENYLPRVLDEIEKTWHPANADLFVDEMNVGPGPRDPGEKPYILMDDEDLRDALAVAACRGDNVYDSKLKTIDSDDAQTVINGSPAPQKITAAMKAAADRYAPFSVRNGNKLLVDTSADAWPDEDDHIDILEMAGVFDEDDDEATEVGVDRADSELDALTDQAHYEG